MSVTLPDPRQLAQQEADRINSNREAFLEFPIQRVIADSKQVTREMLVTGVEEFHAERMSKIPSTAKYPEATPWVQHTIDVDRELQQRANLTSLDLAVLRSLHTYLTFRGFRQAAHMVTADEKCRVAYVPDTDRGEVIIKNVDDPITHWEPQKGAPPRQKPASLCTDGVGSGLHMDDEPDELFPLSPLAMLKHYANDVPSAIEFLKRYSKFWGRANLLLHDDKKRSAAIEKCSFNFCEVFHPGPDGRTHISGMTCRDSNSPQGKHQDKMRQEYVTLFNRGEDCPDNAFWAACKKFEAKLSAALKNLGAKPTFAALVKLFTTTYPEGLNKAGLRIHPNQGLVGYTLITHATLINERKFYRWQRSKDGKTFDAEPEIFPC